MNTRNPHRPEDSIEIGFTVIPHPGIWRAAVQPSLSKTELRVYDALAAGRKGVAELQADLGLQSNLRKALRMLAFQGGSPRNLGGCGDHIRTVLGSPSWASQGQLAGKPPGRC